MVVPIAATDDVVLDAMAVIGGVAEADVEAAAV